MIAAAGVAHYPPCYQGTPKESKPPQNGDRPNASKEVKFTLVLMGDGLTPDRIRTYFKKFKGSDGKILYEIWIDFGTAERAAKEIEELLKESIKTIRRKPEAGGNGQQVGERVLLLRPDPKNEDRKVVLAWTTGTIYREISSDSLEDVLAFEKQYQTAGGAPLKQ
jgi:hypothetical protein